MKRAKILNYPPPNSYFSPAFNLAAFLKPIDLTGLQLRYLSDKIELAT
jgi:hypothetical protein